MNTQGQLSRRIEDLEAGKDGERRDLIISWSDGQPFAVLHMQGDRYLGNTPTENDDN